VPAGDDFRLHAAPVAEAVARDRAAGLLPVAIAAVAGSTNTGSVDAIGELADLAAREGLWLHVDAAYGAAARLSARDAALVGDLDRADSVTVDPHKWLFQAYDIGGLMVRDGSALARAFGGRRPEYYRAGHGPAGGNGARPQPATAADGDGDGADDGHGSPDQLNFWRLGFEGTRRWRALKLWLSWKHVGSEGLGRLVQANIDLARHLAARIAASPDFEALPAHAELSVVCFRHLPGGRPAPAPGTPEAAALDAHQDRLQHALEASGEGWVSTTQLRGATYLRAGILNTQSTTDDIDDLLDILRRLARDG
jgi:aromatic-L-amino-acid/L-tryptophan decarboxylase